MLELLGGSPLVMGTLVSAFKKIPEKSAIKSGKTLVKALNNSEINSAANGYSNTWYELKEG